MLKKPLNNVLILELLSSMYFFYTIQKNSNKSGQTPNPTAFRVQFD